MCSSDLVVQDLGPDLPPLAARTNDRHDSGREQRLQVADSIRRVVLIDHLDAPRKLHACVWRPSGDGAIRSRSSKFPLGLRKIPQPG